MMRNREKDMMTENDKTGEREKWRDIRTVRPTDRQIDRQRGGGPEGKQISRLKVALNVDSLQ